MKKILKSHFYAPSGFLSAYLHHFIILAALKDTQDRCFVNFLNEIQLNSMNSILNEILNAIQRG